MQQNTDKVLHLKKTLGRLTKKLRVERTSFSVNEMAYAYEIARGNLSKIENGHNDPRFSTILKMSEAYGLKFSEFAKLLEDELGENFKLMDE